MRIILNSSVGNNLKNQSEDVRNVKQALSKLGFFSYDAEPYPHAYITREMDDSIKLYQKVNGLYVDGRILPKGETIEKINDDIKKQKSISTEGDMPAIPPAVVDKGELLPPPPKKIIPGTNIPDDGVAEGRIRGPKWGYSGLHENDPRYNMDEGIIRDPKNGIRYRDI